MDLELKVGFIGAGKMAAALASGFVGARLVERENIIASDPDKSARQVFEQSTGITATELNADVPEKATVLFLAVKPSIVEKALAEIKDKITAEHLIVSIAAGVGTAKIENALPPEARVVRVMPNTPALVGECAAGFAPGRNANSADTELVRKLLSSVGRAFELPEPLLDAVTGLSGSGPAFAYMIIDALSDGGVAAGLPRNVSTSLAAQTLLGAAKMVIETGKHPGELKDMVTSPGGTTIEGVRVLEQGNIRAAFIDAVLSAAEKSRSLGK